MVETHHITRDNRAPARAREAIEQLSSRIDPSIVPDAKLLISEIVTNSVKYGRGDLRLHFHVDGTRLRCEVVDDGTGFTPSARTKPSTEVGGWGLYLVESLADRWGVRDGSTHVWFELDASS
ncbi:MAG TPA: ATP-binding protein [Capillimicrobium sp.]|nr:ATP-binding protein [Capillimicrobium sp.]